MQIEANMKILVCIDNDLYFRNFILSGSLDKINNNFQTAFALSDAVVKLRKFIPKSFKVVDYIRLEENKNRVKVFNQISMRHFKKKSSTFDIKTKKYDANFKDSLIFNLFALPFFYNFAQKILLKKFVVNKSLEKNIKDFQPNLVLFPTSGYEATGIELKLLSEKYKFKTFFLTNGWDNLSSKGVLLLKPDYLGVWGPQALVDAVNIQGMQSHQCFLIGCSRYENYFKKRAGDKFLFPFKYILFAGSTTAADEITPLKICDQILEDMKIKDIKIVYRPHPMRASRKGRDLFQEKDFKHIIIDPQVADDYYRDKEKGMESGAAQNFPELNYYPHLLNNALFVISPLSSLILEAAIFDVSTLVLAHPDKYNPIPASLQSKWKHFEGAVTIPGWFFAYNLKGLKNHFRILTVKFKNESAVNRTYKHILSVAIRRYLYFDNKLYKDRLYETIRVIISDIK